MRPKADAVGLEIIGVGHDAAPTGRRLGLLDAIGKPITLGVGDRLFLGVEGELDLRLHIRRRRPAHQGIGGAGGFGFVAQHPRMLDARSRLRGARGGTKYACGHVASRSSFCLRPADTTTTAAVS